MNNPDIWYKLILLYILDQIDCPLSESQLGDFVIAKEYADYFTFKQKLGDIISEGFVNETLIDGKIVYNLSDSGKICIHEFKDSKLSNEIKNEIDEYIKEKGFEFRTKNSTTANYYDNRMGEYDVVCKIKEGENVLMNLTLGVPSEDQARKCVENWRKNQDDIYKIIIEKLM